MVKVEAKRIELYHQRTNRKSPMQPKLGTGALIICKNKQKKGWIYPIKKREALDIQVLTFFVF
jgi:hypothetical protein